MDDRRTTSQNALQGTTAAGARAFGSQLVAFYFRAPVKAFFRMRVDYMTVARAMHPSTATSGGGGGGGRWLSRTTPGLLYAAVRAHGWGFIPRQVLPPLAANAAVGTVLYTSYLQALAALHAPSARLGAARVLPPPPVAACFGAGLVAGAAQSLVAAPLDALAARFDPAHLRAGAESRGLVPYSVQRLRAIGLAGVFVSYPLSLLKESLGYALFFASFEFVKQQGYYAFLGWYYSNAGGSSALQSPPPPLKPHYSLEPVFLLLAGASASITQQVVQHPLSKIQRVHFARLQSSSSSSSTPRAGGWRRTWRLCAGDVRRSGGGWRRWLWRGLLVSTLRQMPSTSAGLIVFELARRRYGDAGEGRLVELGGRSFLLS